MESRAASDLAEQFRFLGDYVNVGGDPSGALQRVVDLARDSIPGCDWVAITQASTGTSMVAASDEPSRLADLIQNETDEGPCLSAAREGMVVSVPDLTTDERWPSFTQRVLAETPIRAVLSFELDVEQTRSALNLYAARPNAFTAESMSSAALFASHARVAVMHVQAATKSANLEQALTTSRQIGTAMGILMAAHKVTEDAAFAMLRQTSQHLHRKLRDVAQEVTETGTLP